jgi:hypothetical protein
MIAISSATLAAIKLAPPRRDDRARGVAADPRESGLIFLYPGAGVQADISGRGLVQRNTAPYALAFRL